MNYFLSYLIRVFSFDVRLPRFNRETKAAIQESRDIMSGRIQAKSYSSAKELFREPNEK